MKKHFNCSAIAIMVLSCNTVFAAALPSGVQWHSNMDEPLFASPEAQFGGTLRTYLASFPQTLRSVGPDSNSGLRHYFMDGVPKLAARHPNTGNWIPQLATAWAFGDDNQTVYFKLDPKARWSDGEKVTADDYLFMLSYYRSKDIVSPWYNDFFTNKIESVVKFDDYTIAVRSAIKMTDDELMLQINLPSNGLQPRPEHFFKPKKDANNDGIDDDFVRRYNFKSEPTTGPYYMDKVKKGKSVTFRHVGKDWWGYSNRYYRHRYNVEKVRFTVIRDNDIARKHFEKGNLDTFGLVLPSLWHEKANSKPYQNGYIHKFWGYNQVVQGAGGLWINTAQPLLDERNIRAGVTYATDFDGMIANVLRGDYARKPHGMGFGHGGYDRSDNTPPAFNPQLAAEYFSQAGFDKIGADGIRVNSEGQRLSFAITYGFQPHTPRIAYLKEQAKQAGLEFTLNLVDGSSAFKYVLEKKHDLAFINMSGGEIPAYWEYLHSVNAKPQTNNHTNFRSATMDRLIDSYDREFDLKKKQAISHQIQKIVSDEYLIVPGYMVPYTREGYWRWIKYPTPAMTKHTEVMFSVVDLATFWIDQQEKEATLAAMKKGKTFAPVTVIDDTYKL
ncbi:ABC transporter substrate-binding protein [Photobacterium gaetbulicola]|uniref:ABC-type dipeptide transport system, periplasmic component n=1 Tax=Photobacterium gaetbulicola Gung47 TaxID=658445 RepID=A0A0C5W7Z2_9GAMM|nr:extracellular solute-binding protein [Photobacterium gaetbulicola]AJR07666.1 ABC-type dipeptide transport system, periplasmic component [Photobacterium gaetbulicola Gung47]PSU03871.1 ABC transporter substrate-binding protein [Photobacterium gaetbulicola]